MMRERTLEQLRDEIQKADASGDKYAATSIKMKLAVIESEHGLNARNRAVHELGLERLGFRSERE